MRKALRNGEYMEQRRRGNTKFHIISIGTKMFLEKGYSVTSSSSIASELGISKGNLTFHFPTKEHLLFELVKILTDFQWNIITDMEQNHISKLERYCSEVAIQIAICEDNEVARDFYMSAYNSPMTYEHIKDWTSKKNYRIFHDRLPDWTMEDFRDVENLTSAIEGGIIRQACDERFTLERKISITLDTLLKIYNIEEKERKQVIGDVLKIDYRKLGKKVLIEFIEYVDKVNEETLYEVSDEV